MGLKGYSPTPVQGITPEEIMFYLQNELERIATVLEELDLESLRYTPQYTEPDNPSAGDTYYADGNQWDPGQGEGLYLYTLEGEWLPLVTGSKNERPRFTQLRLVGKRPSFRNTTQRAQTPPGFLTKTSYAPSWRLRAIPQKPASVTLTLTTLAPVVNSTRGILTLTTFAPTITVN